MYSKVTIVNNTVSTLDLKVAIESSTKQNNKTTKC